MWDDVVKKIATLKSLDNNCVLTYAEYHRYEFNPPVSLEKIVAVEKKTWGWFSHRAQNILSRGGQRRRRAG